MVGCSPPVVGHVLNDSGANTRVGKELRERVERIAAELGYSPSYHGRALREGRSRMLGLVTGSSSPAEMHAGFWGQIIGGLDEGAREADHHLLIVGGESDESDGLERGRQMLDQGQIDALLVPCILYRARPDQMQKIEQMEGPLALLFPSPDSRHPGLHFGHAAGIREAAEHLAALGHRDVLWASYAIDGVAEVPERKRHFCDAARELGMSCTDLVVDTPGPRERQTRSGLVAVFREQVARWLAGHDPPTAVMAYNEVAGLGIYAALRDHGLRVPEDVSVVGYDDIYAELACPPMTVVSLNLREFGREWAKLAVSVASGEERQQQRLERVPTRLVVRASTAPSSQHSSQ
jgi:DNA-binding LacI/PurR family transcriptional regulator